MKLKLLLLSLVILLSMCFVSSPVLADDHAHIIVTAAGLCTIPLHPENIIVNVTSDTCFNVSWDKGLNSPNTLIVMCRESTYGCSLSDIGNLSSDCWIAYNGSGDSFSDCGMSFDLFEYHMTIWGYDNSGVYSLHCINADVKGDQSMFALFILAILALGATFFSFRTTQILMRMSAAIGWLSILLFALSSNHEFILTNPWMIAFILGIMCFVFGLLVMYMGRQINEYGTMVKKVPDLRTADRIREDDYRTHLKKETSRNYKKPRRMR